MVRVLLLQKISMMPPSSAGDYVLPFFFEFNPYFVPSESGTFYRDLFNWIWYPHFSGLRISIPFKKTFFGPDFDD